MATPAILQDQSSAVPAKRQSRWGTGVHIGLFLLTLLTTTMVGMRYMDNFAQGKFPLASDTDILPFQWIWANRTHWAHGLPFSGTILAILLAHEFAHYAACRLHGIRASLPYFVPAPSLSGTAGGIIRLHSAVHSRAALLWIGASGPIVGFIVAIATTATGLQLSVQSLDTPQRLIQLNSPLVMRLLGALLHKPVTPTLIWHPVLLASWVGLLVTSLNLLPAGQLDGGHILYALSPQVHRITTLAMIGVLAILGSFFWVGWLLWAALLLLPGMRHPKVRDTTPLRRGIAWLAPVCTAIFAMTATPQPFTHANFFQTFRWLTH